MDKTEDNKVEDDADEVAFTSPPAQGAVISYEDIDMTLKTKKGEKHILKHLSGHCQPGRLTALMGPSGSGKTSLLNALAGRTKQIAGMKLTGIIKVNGEPVTNWSSFRRLCAYVEQDDLLFHTLTVSETLMLAAELRLPRKLTSKEKKERVNQVIGELGLRKCADTRIGNAKVRGVSGGERKRVSIALEILRGPTVMFLDECTSGLDSFQALRVVATIKRLARNGRTVVTSIHQPRSSIYVLFDDLILLSEGQLMYFGPASNVIEYFAKLDFIMPKNFNPADFALDLVSIDVRNEALEAESKARQERIAEAAKNRIAELTSKEVVQGLIANITFAEETEKTHKYEAPTWKQFLLLAQRAFRQRLRDRGALMGPFFISMFFGLVLGFVYFQNGENYTQTAIQDKAGLLFFICLNQSFNGLTAVISTFPIEKGIVNRERSSKSYSVLPYFFSKVLADLPMLYFPFQFFTIAYWLAGLLDTADAFFQSMFLCLAIFLCGSGIGLVASALMPSPEAAQAIAMPFQLIFALFSGFYANTNIIPVWLNWIQYVSPIRWGFAGFMSILVSPLTFTCDPPAAGQPETGCIPNGTSYLLRLGLNEDSFSRSAGILVGMIIFLQTVGYLILRFKRAKWVVPKPTKTE